jgi:hypothetical protein
LKSICGLCCAANGAATVTAITAAASFNPLLFFVAIDSPSSRR